MNVELGRNRLRGILHLPSPTAAARFASGVLMVAGAGGGLQGPSGIYTTLSRKLQKSGVLALRLDYRRPNQLSMCVDDVHDAIRELNTQYGVERVVLVGWSFGGAVVITAGAQSDKVIGVSTVASQTYGTDAVGDLAPRSLLLLHGTADTCLSANCSKQLYRRAKEPRKIILFEGDDHSLSRHYDKAESAIYDFSISLFNSWGREGEQQQQEEAASATTSSSSGSTEKKRKHSIGGGSSMTSGVTFVSQNKKPVKIGSLLGSLLGRKRRGCSVLHMGTSPLLYQRDQPVLTDDVVR